MNLKKHCFFVYDLPAIETPSEVVTLIFQQRHRNLVQTSEELIKTVKELLLNPYIGHNNEDFYNEFYNLEGGKASKRVIETIL